MLNYATSSVESVTRSVFVDSPSRIFPSLGQIDSKIADEFVDVFGVTEFSKSLLIAATLVQSVAEYHHQM